MKIHMSIRIAIIICLNVVGITHAQEPDTLWSDFYGLDQHQSEFIGAIETNIGNYKLVTINEGDNGPEIRIFVINPEKTMISEKVFTLNEIAEASLSDSLEIGLSLAGYGYGFIEKPDGGSFIIFGEGCYIQEYVNDSVVNYQSQILIVNLDVNDNLVSTNHFGLEEPYDEYSTSYTVTQEGALLVAGMRFNQNSYLAQEMLIKINGDGSEAWVKTVQMDNEFQVMDIEVDDDEIYVLYDINVDETPQLLLKKLDSSGESLWQRQYDQFNYLYGVSLITHDNYVTIISAFEHTDGNGFALFHISSTGELNGYEGNYDFDNYGGNIPTALASDGNYILCNVVPIQDSMINTFNMNKIDSLGNILWQISISRWQPIIPIDILPTTDGGFLLGSKARINVNSSYLNPCIVKFQSEGPLGLIANPGDGKVSLEWEARENPLPDKYYIYRDTDSPALTLIDSVSGSPPLTQFIDSNVENGIQYYYRITAEIVGQAGSAYSSEELAMPNASPSIIAIEDQQIFEDETFVHVFVATDADGDSLNFSIVSTPNVLSLSNIGNEISLIPDQDWNGDVSVELIVHDYSMSDTIDFMVNVIPVNDQPRCGYPQYGFYEGDTVKIILEGYPGPENESYPEDESDQLLSYTITSLPTIGFLSELKSGSIIEESDIPYLMQSDSIFYVSAERFSELNFQFQVQDNGGKEHGGVDISDTGFVSLQLYIQNHFEINTSGSIEGGVTLIDSDILYVASSGDGVHRYDATGNAVYTLSVNGDIKSSTTITSDHTVYIASTDNNLYSFNANGISNTGWPVSLGAEATASVAVDAAGTAYIGTSNGIFQAVTDAGVVSWGYNVGGAVYASAAISTENVLYIVNENGRVFAFDLDTITPSSVEFAWVYDLGEGVHSSPALDDLGNLYVTTIAGNLIKLEDVGTAAQEVWQYSTGEAIYSSPIIGSDYSIYFGCNDGHTYAIDADGSLKWESSGIMGSIISSPAIAESGTNYDRLYVGSDDGYLYALSLIDGSITWKYDAESPIQCPILFSDATVYFGTQAGDVIAIKDEEVQSVLAKLATTTKIWPTFQGNNARTGVFGGGTSIPAISNVHPGDTDNDGDVDAQDILPVGVYFLEQGDSRSSASIGWSGQEVTSWNSYPANFADCNGDGVVDEKDIVAIGVNWGETHDDGLLKYQIDPSNNQRLAQYKESFQRLYASLKSNEGAAGRAMKRVLEEVLGVSPSDYVLYQNYPNPFNPDTEIQFSLPKTTQVSLRIYNIRGELVAELVDGKSLQGGYHTEVFRGSKHSSGIYFYELSTPEFNAVNKMLLVK